MDALVGATIMHLRDTVRRRLLTIACCVTTGIGAAALAAADAEAQTRVTFAPSLAVSAVSDDNVFNTEQRTGDQTTLVGPSLEAGIAGRRGSLRGLYAFDMLRSAYFEALNNIEARRHGKLEAHYRTSPRTALSFLGHYDRSDNAGELNFETALLVPRRRAMRWELNPGFTWQAAPRVTVRGHYNFVREALERTMIANEHVARVSATRELSERSSVIGGYLGRHFVNGDDTQTSHAALFGGARRLRPFTTLTVLAGPRLSSRGTLAAEITASLVRRAPGYAGYMLDYWRGESIILGVLGPVEVEAASARASWPIHRTLEFGASAGLFRSDSLTQGQARVLHGEAVLSWTPQPLYSVAASYGADFQHGDIRTSLLWDRRIERRVFTVTLTIAPRLSHDFTPDGPPDPLAAPRTKREQP
jgi:hypothetical protein